MALITSLFCGHGKFRFMTRDSDKNNCERISRLLQARLNSQAWPIDEARAKLEELVQAAKGGRPQLVGVDDLVVLVNIETLTDIFAQLQRPENWGEYFATAHDGSDNNVEIPIKRSGQRAPYTLDTSTDDPEVDK